MRIGIFSESYEPVLNGVSVSVGTLARELRRRSHEVYVFAPAYRGYRDPGDGVFRFPSLRPPNVPDYPLPIPFMPRLVQRVADLRLDVIHTQTPFMLGWLGLKLGRRLDIPVISTNHTQYAEYAHYFPLAPASMTRSFIVGLMRRYYNACDGVIVPSRAAGAILEAHGIRAHIHVVPTGMCLEIARDGETRRQVRRRYDIPEDAPVLIYVGRLAKEKNLWLLFDSFTRLSKKYPELRLLVVGGGPSENECRRRIAELGLSERTVFTGVMPREEVGRTYCAADVFAFPSMTDTQGLVLCEALQAGLPCVAVRAGGSPEMLEDGGDSLLTANDVDDFADKIDRLLADREYRKRLSTRGIENSARFSTKEMTDRILAIYESACSAICQA